MTDRLIKIPKERIRPVKTVGTIISFYATSEKDIQIQPKLVFEILSNFGIGPLGENVHRLRLKGGSLHDLRRNGISEATYKFSDDPVKGFVIEVCVDDAGLALLS